MPLTILAAKCDTFEHRSRGNESLASRKLVTMTTTLTLAEQATLGARLPDRARARAIRLAAGASYRQVAEELNVHPQTVVAWESGKHRPRGELRARYAQLLAELSRAVAS